MSDSSETTVVGKVVLNNRPMRIHVYEILDECNQLDRLVMAHLKGDDLEKRNVIREGIKRVRALVNKL